MCIWVLFFWWRFFFLLHLRFLLLCRVIVHSSSSTEILTRYTAHNQQWLVNFQQLSEMYQRYNKIRCLRLLDVNYSVFSFLLPRFEIAFWTIIGKRMRTNHFKGEEKRFWLNQNCVRVFFFFFLVTCCFYFSNDVFYRFDLHRCFSLLATLVVLLLFIYNLSEVIPNGCFKFQSSRGITYLKKKNKMRGYAYAWHNTFERLRPSCDRPRFKYVARNSTLIWLTWVLLVSDATPVWVRDLFGKWNGTFISISRQFVGLLNVN